MKKLVTIATLSLTLAGCGLLTPAVEKGLNDSAIAILCALEGEELADPALDKDCQKLSATLSPEQRGAIARHTSKARAAKKPDADAGAP